MTRLSFRKTATPAHLTLHLWVNGAKAGELTVRVGKLDDDERHVLFALERLLLDQGAEDTTEYQHVDPRRECCARSYCCNHRVVGNCFGCRWCQ